MAHETLKFRGRDIKDLQVELCQGQPKERPEVAECRSTESETMSTDKTARRIIDEVVRPAQEGQQQLDEQGPCKDRPEAAKTTVQPATAPKGTTGTPKKKGE
jgi:hypothetical protein